MSKFIPDYVFDSIYDITPEILQSHGIRAALIDLDGTMVSHKTALPTAEVAAFLRRLEDNGIHVVVFSNNNANRVGTFCEPLGVDFISRAHKPFARAYAQAVEKSVERTFCQCPVQCTGFAPFVQLTQPRCP